jgi:hypothetical protein
MPEASQWNHKMENPDDSPESLRDRLVVLDHRIARMRSLNASQGDIMALRLIDQAKAEQRALRARLPAVAGRNR